VRFCRYSCPQVKGSEPDSFFTSSSNFPRVASCDSRKAHCAFSFPDREQDDRKAFDTGLTSPAIKSPSGVSGLACIAYSQMLQHMIHRTLEAEMQAHLGHARHGKAGGNPRNGKSRKTVQSAVGDLQIETPRDREGTFEPQLLPKRQVRLAGMVLDLACV
jgi:hypothetical protein